MRKLIRTAALAITVLGLGLADSGVRGAEALKRDFDIRTGAALETLKEFSAQAGGQLLYSAEAVEGIRTAAVKGNLTPADALGRMFADTDLAVVQDREGGGLMLQRDPAKKKSQGASPKRTSGPANLPQPAPATP